MSEDRQRVASGHGGRADAGASNARSRGSTRRRGKARWVLAALVLSGTIFGISQLTWLTATGLGLAGSIVTVEVNGADAAPAVPALALVAIAGTLVVAISRGRIALAACVVIVLAGTGSVAAAIVAGLDPESAASAAVAEATGVVGGDVRASSGAWPWISTGLAAVLVLAAGGAARRALAPEERGPGRFTRDSAPAEAQSPGAPDGHDPAAADPSQLRTSHGFQARGPRAASTELDDTQLWDALSAGDDPTDERGTMG